MKKEKDDTKLIFRMSEKKSYSFKQLYKLYGKKTSKAEFNVYLKSLVDAGLIEKHGSDYRRAQKIRKKKNTAECRVTRLKKTFGFVRSLEDDTEYFIAGKNFAGALPGDIVLAEIYEDKTGRSEGKVVKITERNFLRFTGNIVNEFGELKIVPDILSNYAMTIESTGGFEIREGDKALAEIVFRGKSHAEHRCRILMSFGSSLKASVCAMSVLELNGVTPIFPPEVIAEARSLNDVRSVSRLLPERLDLRGLPIFTIDGADTKDIDDAVSIERTDSGYRLGVHIADVSYYVKPHSQLDEEAFKRGTSIYYANRVIPMLPKELSNGICSLNPNEDRPAFSVLIDLDNDGIIKDYLFVKTVIRSRVKGVYSEINDLFDGYNSRELCEKYSDVMDDLPIMKELAQKLKGNRIHRGAPQLSTVESELLINEEDICVGARPHKSGTAQEMIEDFMLCANECAARFGRENDLPFVYRVHEDPPPDRLEGLKMGLDELKIPHNFDKGVSPRALSQILESARGTDAFSVINNLVLRSMAKAKYSAQPLGHFGLVLGDYAHFTSPIRRYSDLAVHRIMSDFIENRSADESKKKYGKFSAAAADRATQTEITAMQIERSCEDCYKAEYMRSCIGEEFDGVIVSCMPHGMYVMLDNSCEGLVRLDSLGHADFYYDEKYSIKRVGGDEHYTVGNKVRVTIISADVSAGTVDMELA